MSKTEKKKLDVLKFEPVSFDGEKLVGGFSDEMVMDDGTGIGNGSNIGYCPSTNNCNSGNCVKGCGAG